MSIPGIFCLDSHVLGGVADEEIHPKGIVREAIDVVANGGEETAYLTGTAGTAIPNDTCFSEEKL